jgi:hypothetical protein
MVDRRILTQYGSNSSLFRAVVFRLPDHILENLFVVGIEHCAEMCECRYVARCVHDVCSFAPKCPVYGRVYCDRSVPEMLQLRNRSVPVVNTLPYIAHLKTGLVSESKRTEFRFILSADLPVVDTGVRHLRAVEC